jgi:enoyl-CoA hydratase/carnithine racemase
VRAEYDHNFAFHYGIAKPIIAAINGPAAGAGFVLACYCDIRFAAAGAKLTTSSARLGLPAEYGLSWVLPRLVGIGHAADLLFSSRVVLAEEAARIGLVNRVLPADELLAYAIGYARQLANDVSPSSIRESKRQLYADLHGDVGTAVAESEALLDRMVREADYAEGVQAWLHKRPPHFQ